MLWMLSILFINFMAGLTLFSFNKPALRFSHEVVVDATEISHKRGRFA
jgi:hypothetical protein